VGFVAGDVEVLDGHDYRQVGSVLGDGGTDLRIDLRDTRGIAADHPDDDLGVALGVLNRDADEAALRQPGSGSAEWAGMQTSDRRAGPYRTGDATEVGVHRTRPVSSGLSIVSTR